MATKKDSSRTSERSAEEQRRYLCALCWQLIDTFLNTVRTGERFGQTDDEVSRVGRLLVDAYGAMYRWDHAADPCRTEQDVRFQAFLGAMLKGARHG
jgi:hypothetical protein